MRLTRWLPLGRALNHGSSETRDGDVEIRNETVKDWGDTEGTEVRSEDTEIYPGMIAAPDCATCRAIQPRWRVSRVRSRRSFLRVNSCSQIRTTFQPWVRRVRVTRRSRAWLAEIFFRQNAALVLGWVACLGQPCQKQPSTKTVSFSLGKTKSGLPVSFDPRGEAVMPCAQNEL